MTPKVSPKNFDRSPTSILRASQFIGVAQQSAVKNDKTSITANKMAYFSST
jgi:hypothetical protein